MPNRIPTIRYIIVVVGILAAGAAMVFGSFLPYFKASNFITASQKIQSVRSIKEFEDNFDTSFKLESPVGREETGKFLSNVILNIIAQGAQTEGAARALLAYIEPYLMQNDIVHLLTLGDMYKSMWRIYHQEKDYQKAEAYYLKALAMGEKLPPTLYSLFGLYEAKGDKASAKQIADKILGYWPDDDGVRAAFLLMK